MADAQKALKAQPSTTSRARVIERNVETEFIDSHLPPEENLMDSLTKLISDHKMLFEQYGNYTREADKIFAKYILMIEALNQDHERLKLLLTCEENDPMTASRQRKMKEELISLIEQEACVVKDIAAILEQLKRDQIIVSEKEKIMLEKRMGLSGFYDLINERFRNLKLIQELEYKKNQTAIQLNLTLVDNKKVRSEIDDIKATRQKYMVSYKKMLDEIKTIKQEKAVLLDEAAQCIEDKDNTESMINAILSRNKKEDDLYQQKIESMKQMIRYDTKATDFLFRKLNDREDLKKIEADLKQEELKETLEAESAALANQKEALEAIQDVTDEKDGVMMVHAYNQKEADKMALFNYIADLNGELAHLKQQHASLLRDIDLLKEDDQSMNTNFNETMRREEIAYISLTKELEQCDKDMMDMCRTMDIIKTFIECTFMKLGCSLKIMEDTLGLNLKINPGNMSVYLREIETTVCKIIHAYKYSRKLASLQMSEEDEGTVKKIMKSFEPAVIVAEEQDAANKVLHIPNAFIPNPSRDNYASDINSSVVSNKPQFEAMINGVLTREDLISFAKKNVRYKYSIVAKSFNPSKH